jgi:hypothetical protein
VVQKVHGSVQRQWQFHSLVKRKIFRQNNRIYLSKKWFTNCSPQNQKGFREPHSLIWEGSIHRQKTEVRPSVVAYSCAEAGGWKIWSQKELRSEILFQKKKRARSANFRRPKIICSPSYADFRSRANAAMWLDWDHMTRGEHIWVI